MDQNLKCLSAAEEKVLTVKPREALCTARFRFCFAAASPPLVTCRVLSHLLECSILSRLSASLISSFLVAPLPLRRVSFPGAIWGPLGGASVPTSTPGSSYDSFLAVISLNCPPNWHPWAGSQPAGAPPTRAAVEGGGADACSESLGPSLSPSVPSSSLYTWVQFMSVCLSPLFLFSPSSPSLSCGM